MSFYSPLTNPVKYNVWVNRTKNPHMFNGSIRTRNNVLVPYNILDMISVSEYFEKFHTYNPPGSIMDLPNITTHHIEDIQTMLYSGEVSNFNSNILATVRMLLIPCIVDGYVSILRRDMTCDTWSVGDSLLLYTIGKNLMIDDVTSMTISHISKHTGWEPGDLDIFEPDVQKQICKNNSYSIPSEFVILRQAMYGNPDLFDCVRFENMNSWELFMANQVYDELPSWVKKRLCNATCQRYNKIYPKQEIYRSRNFIKIQYKSINFYEKHKEDYVIRIESNMTFTSNKVFKTLLVFDPKTNLLEKVASNTTTYSVDQGFNRYMLYNSVYFFLEMDR